MPLTISLNGADNVGKTTQISLLPCHYTVCKPGGLHESDNDIGEMHRQGRLQHWWWNSSDEDFVCSIFSALARRHTASLANEHSLVTLFDRGVAMFEAVATAVIAVKSFQGNLDKARVTLGTILEEHHLQVPREHLAILLKHGDSLEESVRITMSREEYQEDQRYRQYQTLLQSELQRQEQGEIYQQVIKIGATSSVSDTQNEIREIIRRHSDNLLFQPMLHNLECVYALSGLSESGKSSIAEAFCCHHGSARAFRAKIVYFMSLISDRLGRSVYDLSAKEQALHLLHEIDRFSVSHYWLRIITIESMHQHSVAKWLKMWAGQKLQVIFIDTPEAKRLQRALITPEELFRNDGLKRERGVEMIREDADLILDNDGKFDETLSKLLLIMESKGTEV